MKIVNAYTPVYPSEDGREIRLTAVLTVGKVEDNAVYIGYGSPDWVAQYGDKLTFDRALFFFPFLARKNYRR